MACDEDQNIDIIHDLGASSEYAKDDCFSLDDCGGTDGLVRTTGPLRSPQ